jgi:hypothetical protein
MQRARTLKLLVVLGLTIAATLATSCADPTAPVTQRQPRANASHDETDPTACRSGYVIIGGRVVCNE